MSRIILITDDPLLETRIQVAFSSSAKDDLQSWSASAVDSMSADVGETILSRSPDVVALGPDVTGEVAFAMTGKIVERDPAVQVILLAEPTVDLWKTAVRAGAKDIVDPDVGVQELREAIDRALDHADRVRRQQRQPDATDGASPRVLTVVSPKGGSGKTTIAANLAVQLAQNAPGEVVLVDLDLQFGDVSNAFHLTPEHTIFDATRSSAVAENTLLKVFLTSHASGVYVLGAPFELTEADQITPEDVVGVLKRFRQEFRYMVIDTAAGIDDFAMAAIDHSTDLIALSATDVPSVRAVRKQLDALDAIGMNDAARHFVLNRADAKVGLEIADIESTVGLPIDVQVPSSRAVPLSINIGEPVSFAEPRSMVASSFGALAAHITGDRSEQPPAARSFLRWRSS